MSRRPYYKLVNPVGAGGPVHTDLPPRPPGRSGSAEDPMTSEIDRLKAGLFKALGHPLRIQIVELLTGGERNVADLIARTGAEASHLSQQLGVLRKAGVLVSRREASTVFYWIRDPRTLHLLATAREILATSLTESRDLLADLQAKPPETVPARPSAELRR